MDSLRAPRLSNTASGRSAMTHSVTAEDSSAAWKHVKNVVKDDGKPVDLHTLLTHSVRETQYSLQPSGVSFESFPPLPQVPHFNFCWRKYTFCNGDHFQLPSWRAGQEDLQIALVTFIVSPLHDWLPDKKPFTMSFWPARHTWTSCCACISISHIDPPEGRAEHVWVLATACTGHFFSIFFSMEGCAVDHSLLHPCISVVMAMLHMVCDICQSMCIASGYHDCSGLGKAWEVSSGKFPLGMLPVQESACTSVPHGLGIGAGKQDHQCMNTCGAECSDRHCCNHACIVWMNGCRGAGA